MIKEKKYCYEYPRPALTTDCVIFAYCESGLKVLLIERGFDPYKGKWAFPGGFLNMDEDAETGAKRELFEETGLQNIKIEQLYTFSEVNRDPRGRVISIVYFAIVPLKKHNSIAGDDAKKVKWFNIKDLPDLAFDHQEIFDMALKQLRSKIRYQATGLELFADQFTLDELEHLYKVILDTKRL